MKPTDKHTVQHPDTADYYYENGLLIFTRSYHLKRGSCCKSGCRHCPYGFKFLKSKTNPF